LTASSAEYRNTIFAGRRAKFMKDAVRKLNIEYGFNLTEQEIDTVAKQAEEAALLFQPLFEVDIADIAPLTKVDKRVKPPTIKKGKK